MGQLVGKMFRAGLREIKMYNIENRAEKVVSKDKPSPAPMYPTTIKELDRLNEENVSKDYLYKKDIQLDDNLRKVFVMTPEPAPPLKQIENPDRPLPRSKGTEDDVLYGYSESEELKIPEGRVSLRQALEFIADHKTSPETNTNTVIADKYKLHIKATDDILEFFKMFNMEVHKKERDPESLSTFEKLNLRVKNMNMLNIDEIIKEIKQQQPEVKKINTDEEVKDGNEVKVEKSKDSSSSENKLKEKG